MYQPDRERLPRRVNEHVDRFLQERAAGDNGGHWRAPVPPLPTPEHHSIAPVLLVLAVLLIMTGAVCWFQVGGGGSAPYVVTTVPTTYPAPGPSGGVRW